MLEAVAHVGVGLQVKDPVAALEGVLEQLRGRARRPRRRRTPGRLERVCEELPPAGAEVVDDHDLDALCDQAVGEVAADEPGAAGDAGTPHAAADP